MPEWDSAYGAKSKAAFDAGQAPKGTYGGSGNVSNKNISAKNVVQGASTAVNVFKGNIAGAASSIISLPTLLFGFLKESPQKKSERYKKKGFDINNPAEMKSATKKPQWEGPQGHQSGIKSLTTAPVTSVVSEPETKGYEWGFQAYSKGDLVKGTKQELSGGVRFGPPPKRGPDPQGLDVILSNTDYFKDLVK